MDHARDHGKNVFFPRRDDRGVCPRLPGGLILRHPRRLGRNPCGLAAFLPRLLLLPLLLVECSNSPELEPTYIRTNYELVIRNH